MAGGQRSAEMRNLTARQLMERIATNREADEHRKAREIEKIEAIKAAKEMQELKGEQDFIQDRAKAADKLHELQVAFGNNVELERLKKSLIQAKSPEELKLLNARADKLLAEATKVKEGKPTDEFAAARLKIAQEKLGLDMDKVTKAEMEAVAPTYLDRTGNEVTVPFKEREAAAIQANQRGSNSIYYQIKPETVQKGKIWDTTVPGEVTPIMLPKHPVTGEQMTIQRLYQMAATEKTTPEQLLIKWGLLK